MFLPERFDVTLPEHKPINPYAYIPFGVGPRTCLGNKFSHVEAVVFLANLVRKFKIGLPVGFPKEMKHYFGASTRPVPRIQLTIKRR